MITSGLARYIVNITNIPWTVGRHELALYFSQFGCVIETFVAFDKKTGLNKGNGYIRFLKQEHVNAVLERKHTLEGKDLIVSGRK